ncbi:type IV secretory system conjugative DNA transfer family protein [Breznakia pachnodae]|uniref:Type IV secretion system protein VirD4 n=1 Tax=Breznakia pachnodae TaxID=265178 RepID=A0ABU0E740_9FIRM|nr:type IV secretory system conjugative DNA transfer family protein [Breznakia pachnodae]MDQ0362524.1 type IV secretion system protein VirD4 [Breznakia pachnodae]
MDLIANIGLGPLLIGCAIILICIIGGIASTSGNKKLKNIKAEETGDGQHGTDRFMTEKEMREFYTVVKLPTKIQDMSHEWKPGRVVHYIPRTREVFVDTSNTHASIEAPTEVGKTSTYFIPNVQYNMMAGANMIIPGNKPEVMNLTMADAQALGYYTPVIDFDNPGSSIGIDFFDEIIEGLEMHKKTGDLMYLAEAESAAQRLADEIITKKDAGNNVNQFFIGASSALIHSVSLLVCMFGKPDERHLSSVVSLIKDINDLPGKPATKASSPEAKIKRLLEGMKPDFGPKKHIGAAWGATEETESNIYASVLDDLKVFNNTQAEQIISMGTKKNCFTYRDLVDKKCILYINMPETKPEFLVFAKLIIKKVTTQLANHALKHYDGVLPKIVKVMWDEFGVSPAVKEFEKDMTNDRQKGILFDLIYQDKAQVKYNYGEDLDKIIRNSCATQIVLGLAPTDEERAKAISESIGTKTIKTGSVSKTYNSGPNAGRSSSISEQMTDRYLMTAGEILRMENKEIRLLFRRSKYPFKAYFPSYYKEEWGLTPKPRDKSQREVKYYDVSYMPFEDIQEYLDRIRKENGTFSESSINVSFIPELNLKNQSKEDAFLTVMNQISEITNRDVEALSLLDDRRYPEFMKYMKKYSAKISRFELQSLLEQVAD